MKIQLLSGRLKKPFTLYRSVFQLNRPRWQPVLFALLLVVLNACSDTPSVQKVNTAAPGLQRSTATATPAVPAGTVLYHADWSKGIESWQHTGEWTVGQNMLHLNAPGSASITIPYQPSVHNYAIEVEIQIVQVLHNGGTVEIVGQQTKGKDGFVGGINSLVQQGNSPAAFELYVVPTLNSEEKGFITSDDWPGNGWRTYRLEVQNGWASFFTNGNRRGSVYSTRTDDLSHGPLRLNGTEVVLNIRSLKIVAL